MGRKHIDNTMVYWSPRGIGYDSVPCFVTKQLKCDGRPNISGFVSSREDGEKVVEIFGGYARLDYREREPNWIQVKVGVEKGHEEVLERLMVAVNDGILTPKRLAWAVNPPENRDGEPAVIRLAMSEPTEAYAKIAKRVQQIYDDYDMASGHHSLNRLSVNASKTKYSTQLWLSGLSMDRILSETNSYGEKFWYWFTARNRLLDDRAPCQVFIENPEQVIEAAKAYFKKD